MSSEDLPQVIIGCPVSHRVIETIDATYEDDEPFFMWLDHIKAQDYSNFATALYMNDVTDKMYTTAVQNISYIERVDTHRPAVSRRSRRSDDDRSRNEQPFERYAESRNALVDLVLKSAPDSKYLFSIDSDILIHPDATSRCVSIMEENPDIAMLGIPVNNSRRRTRKHPLGLFMGSAQYSFGHAGIYLPDNPSLSGYNCLRGFDETHIFNVDYVGACVMIRADILRPPLSIRYRPHRQGEDCSFCHMVKKQNLRMAIDPHQVTLHIMDPGLLDHDMAYFSSRKHI